jgi:hypothetical protein
MRKHENAGRQLNVIAFFFYLARFHGGAQTAPNGSPASPQRLQHGRFLRAKAVAASQPPVIRFEDASDKAGINFHAQLWIAPMGSLLEGTGAGCVWFDYNNSGLESLYVVNGRPLDDSMHPFPLKEKPATPAAQSSLSQRRRRNTLPM